MDHVRMHHIGRPAAQEPAEAHDGPRIGESLAHLQRVGPHAAGCELRDRRFQREHRDHRHAPAPSPELLREVADLDLRAAHPAVGDQIRHAGLSGSRTFHASSLAQAPRRNRRYTLAVLRRMPPPGLPTQPTAPRALGYKVTISLREGIARTVDWYRAAETA